MLFYMLRDLVFVLFALFDQGEECLEFCLAVQAALQSLYPFLHVFLLCVLEALEMVSDFFLHVL